MALASWLERIAARHTTNIELGLERISAVARQLQVNQFACPVITVAGTNGKGSTVSLLENTYTAAGYRVGAYYSPHVYDFCERVHLEGKPVTPAMLCAAFAHIENTIAGMSLTFFEFITLAALWIFSEAKLDVLILEVGLGGRLDAVNCIDTDLAIITQIDYDHCDRLGDDLESIGREKAGIFRQNQPVVCGQAQPPETVIQAAETLQCPYFEIGKDFRFDENEQNWQWFGPDHAFLTLPKPLIHPNNAATAVMALVILFARLPFDFSALNQALCITQLPGRWEIHHHHAEIIFDVAHNEASVKLLAQQLATQITTGKTVAVFSALADKNIHAMIEGIKSRLDEWHVIPIIDSPRAESAEKIVQTITELCDQPCYNHCDVDALWSHLTVNLQPQDRVVVFGSFHTVAAVRKTMKEISWK